ncbi:FkbM family methyltransferase [Paenarthrobacter sp. UW852]|uniref:FkbM family methyltransferase n=1 Tax=Paenarthrobacter sp. UW852 TaxID=2951989 RepID=UPI0021483DDC|nr:FkbM family methyltransferase [Paenarthrobacter sp. UW852]MCR1163665.1 FkbM family methyltransferase [Paenarthrobacter sp. UW852]
MKTVEIVANGTTYQLNLPEADRDYIQKTIASTHRPYEESMLIDIADVVAPGDLVLDIGANCGNHTLYLSCVAGVDVHAFEPDGELCDVIRSSALLNGVDDLVTVHEVGVGDAGGFARLVQTSENNRGAQRLERVSSEDGETTIIRLDDLEFSKPVRVIKIDVEGMEMEVLKGAKNLVERYRPDIYLECQTRQDFERIHRWLTKFDYRYLSTFNATPTHRFVPNSSSHAPDRFEQIVKQQVAATYYDQQLISSLRKNLTEANLKYRGATAQLAPLNEQLRLLTSANEQASERVSGLELELSGSIAQRQDAETSLAHKELELASIRSQLDVLALRERELVASSDYLSNQYQEALETIRHERSFIEKTDRQIVQANARITSLESEIDQLERQHEHEAQTWQEELQQQKVLTSKILRMSKMRTAIAKSAVAREEVATNDLRELTSRLADVQAALESANRDLNEATKRLVKEKGMVSRLERAIDESKSETAATLHSLRQENSSLRASLDDAQKKLIDADKGSAGLQAEADRTRARVSSAEAEVERLQSELAAARQKIEDVRTSVTFRLGKIIRESAGSPKAVALLPVRLGRLAGEHRARQSSKAILGEVVPEGETENAVLSGSPVVVNRSAEIRASRRLQTGYASAALQLTKTSQSSTTRIAAIMDEFTVQSFAPECELLELSLENYAEELVSFAPELVFLESAWRGKGDSWGNKVAQASYEVREIISWAKSNSVPVILWNKEDPVHYSTFLNTANLVDHIFTTDIDCVQRYKEDLGHDRVHFLPFACQPTLHNPLEIYDRNKGMAFAGAYYRRYPDRTRDLESFIDEIPNSFTLEIFDRNFGKSDVQYQFPNDYNRYIVGTLTSSEIDLAYKGYDYAINLNSVKESQSMFARRVYELLASNTTVVSNYSRGLQLLFGEIPVVSDSGRVVVKTLTSTTDVWAGRRRRLAGLRKVMREHTYSHRLQYVLNRTGVCQAIISQPKVVVFGLVSSSEDVARLQVSMKSQFGVDISPRLYTEVDDWLEPDGLIDGLHVSDLESIAGDSLADLVPDGSFAAFMVPEDYYGQNYLLDLALASRYSSASVAGKPCIFRAKGSAVNIAETGPIYSAVEKLPVRCSLVLKPETVTSPVSSLLRSARGASFLEPAMLATEVFDYCKNGAALPREALDSVSSGRIDSGLGLDEMVAAGDRIHAADVVVDAEGTLSGAGMAELFVTRARPGVQTEVRDDAWHFDSDLADGAHDYIYALDLISLDSIAIDGRLEFHVEANAGLNLQVAIIYYDGSSAKIEGHVRAVNQNHTMSIPENAVSVKLGVRIFASGQGAIRRILWKHKNVTPAFIASRADNLVITNRYPSYGDLYKNGFVHSRVRRYIDSGVPTEVFVLDDGVRLRFREFEGVTVISGPAEALAQFLRTGKHRAISLHFVNDSMWDLVRDLPGRPRIAIWAHGADIQKWSRRKFLYKTEQEVAKAKELSEARLSLWRRIFREASIDVSVVFVSKWLAETAVSDLGLDESRLRYCVIHNPIDTLRFEYRKKSPSQRFKILSIRPYASSVYANDLTVDAILLLSKTEQFAKMEFRLIGDGPLFDEITRPLLGFANVFLDKRFLAQDEIAEIHKDYGVFLCPSRMDSQGVSRDEAMSSGLVPVTTRIAAIPEFADEACGELVEPENAADLADALLRLAASGRIFRRKSKAAAKRVRSQVAASRVVPQELEVLGY